MYSIVADEMCGFLNIKVSFSCQPRNMNINHYVQTLCSLTVDCRLLHSRTHCQFHTACLVAQSGHSLLQRLVDDLLIVANSIVAIRESLAGNLA